MSTVIYLDENNKELLRKEKGRGRQPKEIDKDGNFIVRISNERLHDFMSANSLNATSTDVSVEDYQSEDSINENQTQETYSIDEILNGILALQKDVVKNEDEIQIINGVIIKRFSSNFLSFNSLYSKIVIIKSLNKVQVFSKSPDKMGNYGLPKREFVGFIRA